MSVDFCCRFCSVSPFDSSTHDWADGWSLSLDRICHDHGYTWLLHHSQAGCIDRVAYSSGSSGYHDVFVRVFFVPEPFRPVAAYIAGTMGAIIGGNLIPLLIPRFRNSVGTPVVSIGGPGTFGGVFVAGILSVLLA